MNVPQTSGADATGDQTDAEASGQASAFRRALDAQAVEYGGSPVLVPRAAHDLTAPFDAAAVRTALSAYPAKSRDTVTQDPAMTVLLPSVSQQPVAVSAVFDVPGPGVPARTAAAHAARPPAMPAHTIPAAPRDDPPQADSSPRHAGGDGGGAKPGRMRTTVGLCVLLGTLAAGVLIINAAGNSSDPLAPSALPSRAASHVPVVLLPSGDLSASPTPHAAPRRSAAPSRPPSPSASASATASPAVAFVTLWWGVSGPVVTGEITDVQRRLASLKSPAHPTSSAYLVSMRHYGEYGEPSWICGGSCPYQPPDPSGAYYNATQAAVQAFQSDFGLPVGVCDTATYNKLVSLTGG